MKRPIHWLFSSEKKNTGAFFDEDDVDSLDIFDIAISRQNAFNTKFRLEPIIKRIASMDSFQAEQAGKHNL